jgi:outer membrane protein TolC
VTGALKQTGLVVPVELNDKSGGPYTVFNAGVSLRYTLFDFGQRSALTSAAKRKQLAANLTFNATHQTVTFQVTQAYYTLETTRRLIETAEISAASASDILAATQDKFEHGLVTEPNLLQARQAKAQGEFDLVNARSNWEVARVNLIEVIGAEPLCALKVAPANFASLGNQIQEPLDSFVQSALQKPDLLAKVAEVQAAQASLRAARAAPLPTVSITAMQNYSQFETTIQGSGNVLSNVGLGFQNYGGFVKVEWPIFDGGLDSNKIKAAESSWREATDAVLLAWVKSIADVLRSYTSVKAALARRESAEALQTASKAAYDSLRASFDLGITPIQDVLAARTSLAQAMALRATADGAVAASLATLTYVSGRL